MKQECEICHKIVKNIYEHRLVHSKERPYSCKFCEKSFKSKQEVQSHQNRVHLGVKEECPICHVMVKNLRQHKGVHSNARPFSCQFCGKTYKTKYGVQL